MLVLSELYYVMSLNLCHGVEFAFIVCISVVEHYFNPHVKFKLYGRQNTKNIIFGKFGKFRAHKVFTLSTVLVESLFSD